MVSSSSLPSKRRWRRPVVVVLFLFLSLMIGYNLTLLRGLHNGSRSGRLDGVHKSGPSPRFRNYGALEIGEAWDQSEGDETQLVNKLLRKFGPELQKDVIGKLVNKVENKTVDISLVTAVEEPNGITHESKDIFTAPEEVLKQLPDLKSGKADGSSGTKYSMKTVKGDESQIPCPLRFGSYCVWREEHKQKMHDLMVKKLKDQLFVARAYYPSIAKLPAQSKLSNEMRMNIQELERLFSIASTDTDLPLHVEKKFGRMETAISKAKSFNVDCVNVVKKYSQLLDLTEDEARFHMKQSAFLYQLAVQTKPKSHHCLSMRLTVEYFRSLPEDEELQDDKDASPASFYHYVIFSNNLLGSSVVINSTVMHAKETEKHVFHIVTDGENYAAMKLWFFRNSYKNATINILNIENLDLNDMGSLYMPRLLFFSEEYRVSVWNSDRKLSNQMRTEFISVFGSSHALLPVIFQSLEKVVVLDDDVVVQKDLSPLWSLDMEGKVNAAVEDCRVRLGQLKSYLANSNYDSNSCAWMSGLNVIDLKRWRELKVSETYLKLLQAEPQQTEDRLSDRVAALRANLLTFQNHTYPLHNSWTLSGLGHDYGVKRQTIEKAPVLHYNGNLKPWLDLAIPKYKGYWKKHLMRDQYLDECNVSL